jgi:hypothetical protein
MEATWRTPMSRDELQRELQLAINLSLSCWARMEATERDMALRLASKFENCEGYVELDWRKALRDEMEAKELNDEA